MGGVPADPCGARAHAPGAPGTAVRFSRRVTASRSSVSSTMRFLATVRVTFVCVRRGGRVLSVDDPTSSLSCRSPGWPGGVVVSVPWPVCRPESFGADGEGPFGFFDAVGGESGRAPTSARKGARNRVFDATARIDASLRLRR